MPLYEHVYLARQDLTAQQVESDRAVQDVIEGLGGKIEKAEYWGVKSLAYRIKKNRKAHFTLMNVDAPPAAITEIERQEGAQRRRAALSDHPRRRATRKAPPR